MIGDIAPFAAHALSGWSARAALAPDPGLRFRHRSFRSIRNYKISENQSPRPQDRVFFDSITTTA